MAADGSYTYDPHSIAGIESLPLGPQLETFNYSIADGHGDVASSTLAITVNIDPETVTAVADTNAVSDDATLTVNAAAGVLANDTADADDQLAVTTTGNLTGSLGGTLVMAADGSYTYDPHSIAGIESLPLGPQLETFNYSIADGHGDVASSTLAITVNIPVKSVDAKDDTATVSVQSGKKNNHGDDDDHHHHHCDNQAGGGNGNGNTTLVVSAADGVLSNDLGDPDDPLHVSAVNGQTASVGQMITLLSGAHLTLNTDGSYIYDPSTMTILQHSNGGGVIHDTFQYTVSDGHGDMDTAMVDITVNVGDNNNNHHHHHHDHGHHFHDERFEDHGSGWLSQAGGSNQHDIVATSRADIPVRTARVRTTPTTIRCNTMDTAQLGTQPSRSLSWSMAHRCIITSTESVNNTV
jgi:VCBS repeat-containing protein